MDLWFKETFPHYTKEMYTGNEPCGEGYEMASSSFSDWWLFSRSCAETSNDEILAAVFYIDINTNIFIDGDIINISKVTSKYDYNYCNKSTERIWGTFNESLHRNMEFEEVKKILNKEFPNCKIWSMIQAKAKELCGV